MVSCGGGGRGAGRGPGLPLRPSARARRPGGGAAGPPQPGAAMSVAFVPERLRGKVEVNQETLQRVSETGLGRGRDGAETGPGLSRTVTWALPARY